MAYVPASVFVTLSVPVKTILLASNSAAVLSAVYPLAVFAVPS